MFEAVGFTGALLSIIFWGTYFVPMKKIKYFDPFYYQFLMCISIFLTGIFLSVLFHAMVISIYGIISGIIWTIGNTFSIFAVRYSGLAKSSPVWMSTVVLVSFAWGVIYFRENLNLNYSIFGILLMIIGIFLISYITPVSNHFNKSYSIRGMIFAIIAGIIFGSQLVPLKLSKSAAISYIMPMSFGILIGGLMISLLKKPKIAKGMVLSGSLSGIMWEIANIGSFFAVTNLGLAVGQPLTQMALFISVLWGILYFKEIRDKNKIFKLIAASILLFVGSILLSFAYR